MRSQVLLVLAAGFLLAAACGSDTPAPPSVSMLVYSPMTIPAHQSVTVSGTFRFEDPNGDVATAHVAITAPGRERQETPSVAIQGSARQGAAQFAVALQDPVPGTYGFDVWVRDRAGNDSNVLSGSVLVQ
jgi:hypothetical protein